jgi:hypothetical protein
MYSPNIGPVVIPTGPGMRAAVRDLISTAVERVQRKARTRRITESLIEAICDYIQEIPRGQIQADGGTVTRSYSFTAESTQIGVWWWRRGRELRIALGVSRVPIGPRPAAKTGPQIGVMAANKSRHAGGEAWPERLEALQDAIDRRFRTVLTRRGYALPPADVRIIRFVPAPAGKPPTVWVASRDYVNRVFVLGTVGAVEPHLLRIAGRRVEDISLDELDDWLMERALRGLAS